MKLPNADQAVVTEEEVAQYLLNPAHPDNGGKAGFFEQLGFQREAWEALAAALRRLAQTAELSRHAESSHGGKCVVLGRIASPTGRTAMVRTVWIVDKGRDVARVLETQNMLQTNQVFRRHELHECTRIRDHSWNSCQRWSEALPR